MHSQVDLERIFDAMISTDAARTSKPDPKAYRLGVDQFGIQPEDALFVAYASWDVAGAKWFGYPAFWLNRASQPAEDLKQPDGSGTTMSDLLAFELS